MHTVEDLQSLHANLMSSKATAKAGGEARWDLRARQAGQEAERRDKAKEY